MAETAEILQIFGALVAVLVGAIIIILAIQILRAKRRLVEEPELPNKDFFACVSEVSSDADYYVDGAGFGKEIRLVFKRIDAGQEKPLAIADASMKVFARLNNRINIGDVKCAMSIRLCGKFGNIMAKTEKGELAVKLNREAIGKISLQKNTIKNSDGLNIGNFGKIPLEIAGRDVLGLPFISRRGNFSVSHEIEMHSRTAAIINYRKWPDSSIPLLEKLDKRLKKEEIAILFALAAFEWALSVNLRE